MFLCDRIIIFFRFVLSLVHYNITVATVIGRQQK